MRNLPNIEVPAAVGQGASHQAAGNVTACATGPVQLTCRVQVSEAVPPGELSSSDASNASALDASRIVVHLTIGGEAASDTAPIILPDSDDSPVCPQVELAEGIPSTFPDKAPEAAPADDLDEACEPLEQAILDEPEVIDGWQEMAKGFAEADRVRNRRIQRLRITSITAVAALGFVLCAVGLTEASLEGSSGEVAGNVPETSQTAASADDAAKGEGSGENAGAGASANGAQSSDLSGTVVYSYVSSAADGGEASVKETVVFDAEGYADTSYMEVRFESEHAASSFLERMERDYGSTFLGGSVDGSTVQVRVDVSESRLNKAAYEKALAETARDVSASDDARAA